MAAPIIKLKRSAVEGKIPSTANVPLGELALNTYDGYLYASKDVGAGVTVIAINPWRVGTGTDTYDISFTAGNVGVGTDNPTSALTVSGNITITGTVDGRDLSVDGAKLDGIESGATADQTKADIDALNINADQLDSQEGSYYLNYNNFTNTPTIPTNNNQLTNGAGYITSFDITTQTDSKYLRSDVADTMSADLTIADDKKLYVGDTGGLEIYHAASNETTYITETGTGALNIGGDGSVNIANAALTEYKARFFTDGAVELYYDNVKKFETTSTGVSVTGDAYISGNFGVGTSSPGEKLDVVGSIKSSSQLISSVATGTAPLSVSSTTVVTNLNADLLDGQEGSYYQQASTALTTSTTFGGDVSGTYNSIVIADDSHDHIISNVDGLQNALDLKAPLASPTLTGTPTAPTATAGTNTTQIATTAFVSTAVSNLVDSAPTTLDTLNELAAALGDDPNFATTVTNSIATKLPLAGGTMTGNITFSGAQTVDGRDVSADGAKLDGIESGATADQTASEILTAIKTVDGSGSGLDADTLDGQQGSYYQPASTALTTSTTFGGDVSGTYNAIVVADDSHTHDGRYYTESESDARFLGISAKAADSNLLDGIDSGSFLRSDAADTSSTTYTFTNTSTTVKLDFSGHAGAANYNYFMRAGNDTGNKAVHFVNGSTRTADGGANTYTIRNDGGDLRLGRSNYNTLIEGNDLRFDSGNSESARIDSSGRLLAGTTSARTDLIGGTRGPRVQIEEANSVVITALDNSSLSLTMGSSSDLGSANIFFTRTKSDSLGGVTTVINNQILGGLYFQGTDGTDAVPAALIKAEVDGTPGANDMPGRLVFSTTADGASSPTEHFRIANNGDLTATDTTIGSNSDSRLKINVADFTYDLEDFKQYQPKTFDWKNPELHGNKTGQRGFIAQDVEAIDSYWVDEQAVEEGSADAEFLDADRLAKTLKLGKKDAMYVSVIQQLLSKVETLESKVAALESGT